MWLQHKFLYGLMGDVTDPATYGYGFDVGYLSDYLEIHRSRASLSLLVSHPIQAREDPGRVAAA